LEFPFGVKLRTNSPALAFVALGFVPLIYPIWNLTTGYVRVEQELRSNDYPVTVYVGVGTELSYRDGKVVVLIPLIQNPDYKPQLIYRGSSVVDKVDVDLTHQKHGLVVLDPEDLQNMRRARTPRSSDVSPPPERFKERNTE